LQPEKIINDCFQRYDKQKGEFSVITLLLIKIYAMKKIIAVLMVVFFAASQLGAQQPSFEKGSKVLNLGVGLGMLHVGSYYKTTVPPISVSWDIGIVDGILKKAAIGIGPYFGYSASKYEVSGWGWKYNDIIVGVRGSFHYPFVDKLDTYAGVLLGWDIILLNIWPHLWSLDMVFPGLPGVCHLSFKDTKKNYKI
jgi:hypothetical protein